MISSLATWIRRLETAAGAALGQDLAVALQHPEAAERWILNFRDDAGHRRSVDAPLLHHILNVPPRCVPSLPHLLPHLDIALWWRVASGDACPFTTRECVLDASGPLVPHLHHEAIELWSTAELSAVHAMAWLSIDQPEWAARGRSAAQWLLNHVQPDNATNHPWGVHVFAAMEASGDLEAGLYAQTLLNNALVGRERADRFSACVLFDAAQCLRAMQPEFRR